MVTASVETGLAPTDDTELVRRALLELFPGSDLPDAEPGEVFPTPAATGMLRARDVDLTRLQKRLREQRICDTALDAMAFALDADRQSTCFSLSRQAALAGKVAFVLPGERVLGGTFEVSITGEGLAKWIEEFTWHAGREAVPRYVADEVSMRSDGSSRDWFDD